MQLKGKVALVTGAARRVGREIALAVARRGASVVVHYRGSESEARGTVRAIQKLHMQAVSVQADLRKAADMARLAEDARRAFGRLDVLVNSAAAFVKTPLGTVTEEQWNLHLETNLRGPFFLAQAAASELRKRKGAIVNIADWAGVRPYEDYAPYVISKAGVIGMTKMLARELAPDVRVNAVMPGPVLMPEDWNRRTVEEIRKQVPLRRIGSPADIAAAVVFLIEGSEFITGALLPVDGGRLIS